MADGVVLLVIGSNGMEAVKRKHGTYQKQTHTRGD